MTWSKPYDKIDDPEYCWRQFEKAQIRRERFRLIKAGLLVPGLNGSGPPSILAKNPDLPKKEYIFGDGRDWSIKMEIISG